MKNNWDMQKQVMIKLDQEQDKDENNPLAKLTQEDLDGKLTVDQLKAIVPRHKRKFISQELVDKINDSVTDPVLQEVFRDNILGYSNAVMTGEYKLGDYVNAVKFVSYIMLGDSQISAYSKVFPERYQRMLNKNMQAKHMSSIASIYKKGALVTTILEQSMVPTHILNADVRQEAINIQLQLARSSKSDLVRSQAAANLLLHLKPPENTKLELSVGAKESDAIKDLREALLGLASLQAKSINAGVQSAEEIAHSRVVSGVTIEDGEYEEEER